MKLSTVALITLLMITLGYVIRVGLTLRHAIENPAMFVASSLTTWALIFFFLMLYRHADKD